MDAKRRPRVASAHDGTGTMLCSYDDDGVAVLPPRTTRGYARGLLDIFLPAGYPHTVTDDYTPYQIYDSLQAFFSTIAGLIASRAVLEGFGVGTSSGQGEDGEAGAATSSATAAVLLTVLQESAGRLATIAFAHRLGTAIEPECKFYRLLADVLNDAAMALDLLSPLLLRRAPAFARALALCAAGVLRALCGVAAGSAKASLSAHFARGRDRGRDGSGGSGGSNNVAELNAKDGSQETVVSLAGMAAGGVVLRAVPGPPGAVAALMAALLAAHLATNAAAVRAVRLRSLNRQRAALVAAEHAARRRVLRPDQAARRESLLLWRAPPGCPVLARRPPRPGDLRPADLDRHASDPYVVAAGPAGNPPVIYMKEGAAARDVLRAYLEVLTGVLARERRAGDEEGDGRLDEDFWTALASAGWDLDAAAIETGTPVRIRVEQ